eukprot:GHVN01056284.1.p1 GENE.GHVN01056284.1~~GHVN01056284.1.p1  ORF type:complete len:436 (+),score=71.38 GHVN01056284.1:2892-4199(+)
MKEQPSTLFCSDKAAPGNKSRNEHRQFCDENSSCLSTTSGNSSEDEECGDDSQTASFKEKTLRTVQATIAPLHPSTNAPTSSPPTTSEILSALIIRKSPKKASKVSIGGKSGVISATSTVDYSDSKDGRDPCISSCCSCRSAKRSSGSRLRLSASHSCDLLNPGASPHSPKIAALKRSTDTSVGTAKFSSTKPLLPTPALLSSPSPESSWSSSSSSSSPSSQTSTLECCAQGDSTPLTHPTVPSPDRHREKAHSSYSSQSRVSPHASKVVSTASNSPRNHQHPRFPLSPQPCESQPPLPSLSDDVQHQMAAGSTTSTSLSLLTSINKPANTTTATILASLKAPNQYRSSLSQLRVSRSKSGAGPDPVCLIPLNLTAIGTKGSRDTGMSSSSLRLSSTSTATPRSYAIPVWMRSPHPSLIPFPKFETERILVCAQE